MVEKVRWSIRSQQDRLQILDYWIKKNKSNTYSRKLNNIFTELAESISNNPLLGIKSNKENVRFRVISHYLRFYSIKED